MVDFKKWTLALVAVALMFGTVACSDSTLNQVAKFEADLNAACSTTFTIVAGASTTTPPLISTSDAAAIIGVLVTIEQGNRQAQTATASIASLGATDQANLLMILAPIETAINNAVANGTVGIKDPATKTKVQTALVSIQTIINSGVALIKAAKT
jgi:hypothetical protein